MSWRRCTCLARLSVLSSFIHKNHAVSPPVDFLSSFPFKRPLLGEMNPPLNLLPVIPWEAQGCPGPAEEHLASDGLFSDTWVVAQSLWSC